ncbi:MAG: FHA domain-containing protein [Solirubrobacterales bacterium]|nr:FHA domain-containing protein [Solirubrobacterales bacterium]
MTRGHLDSPIASGASLLYAGRRVPVTAGGVTIGRAEESDLMLDDERASRQHARVCPQDGQYVLTDLGSHNGTMLNGERVLRETRSLTAGDTIVIGDQTLRFLNGQETRMASRELPIIGTQSIGFDGERLTIGRDAHNDAVLDHPNVSRFHAEVIARDGAIELVDLGSRNGTRLDGVIVERAPIKTGSQIGVGPFRLLFDGSSLLASDDRGAIRLAAEDVAFEAGGRQVLTPSAFALAPGEFVAIIGESGAGKSTLLKCLAGVAKPTSGSIQINGEPLESRLTDVGYVPQHEIVHDLLTVREVLTYAARLRLPRDASDEEISAAVERVSAELGLAQSLDQRINSLSGGQRRRAGVGTELLGQPGLLFLDEPTTGMDPALESRMMAAFRELADNQRGVALVTHATRNLTLCDRVVVMARGGTVVFEGEPDALLEFFSVDSFDAVYTELAGEQPERWRGRFEESKAQTVRPRAEPASVTSSVRASHRPHSTIAQTLTLTARYWKLLHRDRRNLALLLLQAPVLALTGLALFSSGLFNRPGGRPFDVIQLIFLAILTMVWFGGIDSVRELVKDRGVMARETAIGTPLRAHITSKLIVLCGLVAVQAILYSAVLFTFRPLHASAQTYVEVVALLIVPGVVAVAMGLAISALATTQDQAMSLLPLAIIPQIVFAGAVVPVQSMAAVGRALAYASFARWGLAGTGNALDMNHRLAQSAVAPINRYGAHFFTVSFGAAVGYMAAFAALFLTIAAYVMRRELGS